MTAPSLPPREPSAEAVALVAAKQCNRCLAVLPADSFPTFRSAYTGKPRFAAYCKECLRIRARGRKRSAKQAPRPRAPSPPDKAIARRAVSKAIREGSLTRMPCEVCGDKSQAHHEDYSKPLHVRWLCSKHHGIEHRIPTLDRLALIPESERPTDPRPRGVRGEMSPKAKLTREIVTAMRARFSDGHSMLDIAREFDANYETTRTVLKNRTWRWLERETEAIRATPARGKEREA